MSKVQQFLDELTDNELLSFFHFRYEEFLQGSKNKIDAEIQKRRLNVEAFHPSVARLDHSDEKNCPRCAGQVSSIAQRKLRPSPIPMQAWT